ncbi:ketopantoate reductase C-terminal domain-containing protein, partial [Segatella buccae]|uniref:ketopantoate reductase C-terminal domain-containing protein n=2 Tax=Segatella buccae TaxID=28126 RepID=UPI000660D0D1
HEARWRKAVWNMPFNGLSVALRATTDALLADEASHGLVRALMLEVIGAARALGVEALTPKLADRMIAYTLAMKPYSPSMKLDFDYHRPMEIEFLYTRPI